MIWQWIRFGICAILTICGLIMELSAILGVFKFRFALNRIHFASVGDSLGLGFIFAGLAVAYGFSFATLKLALILAAFWLGSPISAHIIARLEVMTDESLDQHLTRVDKTAGQPPEIDK